MAAVEDTGPAREELVEFLQSAPPRLQAWARDEIAALDEGADTEADEEPAEAIDEGEFEGEFDDDDEDSGPVPRGGPARDRHQGPRWSGRWLRSRTTLVIAGLVVLVAVIGGVYLAGRPSVPGISGTATDTAASGAGTQLDQAKVAALMQKISANPKDTASLAALGDLYFAAADYKTAATWEQKVLAAEPKNVKALLALGAAYFNQGDSAKAEQSWQQVVALDPKQVEAHYDLGFLYLSENPPNMAKVRQEWSKVVEIDPNSEVAKTVSTHLKSLQTASPSASANPSATPGK